MRATLITLVTLTLAACGVVVEPVIIAAHQSDLARGEPFASNPPGREPTNDYWGAGATLNWPRIEVDLTHGRKSFECRKGHCPTESGTQATVRYYPLRRP